MNGEAVGHAEHELAPLLAPPQPASVFWKGGISRACGNIHTYTGRPLSF